MDSRLFVDLYMAVFWIALLHRINGKQDPDSLTAAVYAFVYLR